MFDLIVSSYFTRGPVLEGKLTCLEVSSVIPRIRFPSFDVEDSLAAPGWESNDRRLGRAVRVLSTTSLILPARSGDSVVFLHNTLTKSPVHLNKIFSHRVREERLLYTPKCKKRRRTSSLGRHCFDSASSSVDDVTSASFWKTLL